MTMKLWHLKLTDAVPAFHRTNLGFVIRAETEEEARWIADYETSGPHGREPGLENDYARGGHAWLDSQYSTCEELTADGPEGVIESTSV